MRTVREIQSVLAFVAAGCSDVEISKRTGIPRTTVRDWRHGKLPGRPRPWLTISRLPDMYAGLADPARALLRVFIGALPRGRMRFSQPRTYCLRIFLDAVYPGIVEACRDAVQAVRPENRVWVGRSRTCRCNIVAVCSNHWPCLLPQMGPGRKHNRPIRLEPWQDDVVSHERHAFIRGLLHSDGCRVVANDRGVRSVRYHFSNKSDDIKRIFCDSLDALGINWTRPCDRQIAVYRKASTALLDEFVGPKE
jgi:hypothetical protein